MAQVDLRNWREGGSIGFDADFLPAITPNPSSFRTSPTEIYYEGTASFPNESPFQASFTISGIFNYSSINRSWVTGASVNSVEKGSYSITGFKFQASRFLGADQSVHKNNELSRELLAREDTISGSSYNDKINSLQGNDLIYGSLGDDYLIGGLGDDVINGGDGADTLSDGSGLNFMRGGGGADSFYVNAAGQAGYWTRKKPDTYWDVRTSKVKINGSKKRVAEFFVDNSVDIIEDFNIAEDTIYARGDAVYDSRPQGVQIWDTSERNVIVFLAGITEQQYLDEVRWMSW